MSVISLIAAASILLAGCGGTPFSELGANLEQDALARTAFLFTDARDCIQINAEDAAPVEDADLFVASLEDCAFGMQILGLTEDEILSDFRPSGDGTWLVSSATAEERLRITAYTEGFARYDSGHVAERRIYRLCWSFSFDTRTGSDVRVVDEECNPTIRLVDPEFVLTDIAELEARR